MPETPDLMTALEDSLAAARSDSEFAKRLRASRERHKHILDRLDNGRAETPPKSLQNGSNPS